MARSLQITADGGSRGNPGPAGYGAVVYENGKVLQEVCEAIGVASNNVAEYRGLIAGLTAAHAIDPSATIDVRMDSKLVIEQMSGRWQIKHPDMRQLAKQAREIHPMELITFTWIPREENSHADRLANKALDGAPSDSGIRQQNFLTERLLDTEVPTTVYLIRHGETALTPERRFSGDGELDPALTEAGLQQAAAVAEEIAKRKPEILISSPLQRTRQTAAAIAATTGLDVSIDDQWIECSFGIWDGMSLAEVKDAYPEDFKAWVTSSAFRPPRGESYDEVLSRVDAGLTALGQEFPGQKVAIVTHNGVIKSAVAAALGTSAEAIFHVDVQTCSITTIAIWPSDGLRALRSMNERSHIN
jgi:probable phosphoglycerate mutase